ncbi:hypothetical protein FBU59_005447 [Linderina macrospora]|uniref:Uncharacterized protein n=1 Tax=Linderina macrospora TaxID=4868 RepID=A0ACC1J2Z2_9FUNG|nr:hypothetical protein FBU59_005447 [Linderina macrospora]
MLSTSKMECSCIVVSNLLDDHQILRHLGDTRSPSSLFAPQFCVSLDICEALQ